MKIVVTTFVLSIAFIIKVHSQDIWTVPAEEAKKISPFIFTDDMKQEGARLYENSCVSCHGNPGMANYAKLSPSPGDPANEKFQTQTDGSLFNKIRKGRGVMPGFENIFSEEETWSIIAYIRDFNKTYVQQIPTNTGNKISILNAKVSFDDNINNLVVKVLADSLPEEGIRVTAFVKSRFGLYALPKTSTNKQGIAYVTVDNDLPADSTGSLVFVTKINKGLATIKTIDTLLVGEPNLTPSVIEGRHLWSTADKAPIWLQITFWATIIIIWGTIGYIFIGLTGLKTTK